MVIIRGSQWWLLHAVCPLSWHHKKGMAHALFICVCVPPLQALRTNITQALCSSSSKSLMLSLSLLPPSVSGQLGVMLVFCSCKCKNLSFTTWGQTGGTIRQRDRPLHSILDYKTSRYPLIGIQEMKLQFRERTGALFARVVCLIKPHQVEFITLCHSPCPCLMGSCLQWTIHTVLLDLKNSVFSVIHMKDVLMLNQPRLKMDTNKLHVVVLQGVVWKNCAKRVQQTQRMSQFCDIN